MMQHLSKWDKTRRVSGTNTGSTVFDWLVGQTELAQVVADHLSFDFHLVERFAVVNAHNAAHHFRYDDRVTQVSLHHGRLLQWWRFLLDLAQFFQQSERFTFQASVVTSSGAAIQQLDQLIAIQLKVLI